MTYSYDAGTRFISVGAAGNYGNIPANPGNTTGAGDAVGFVQRVGSQQPNNFTWDVVISGGTVSALNVTIEISSDNVTWYPSLDTSTNTSGEMRQIVNTPARYLRAKVVTRTVGTGTPIIEVGIYAAV